MENLLNNLAVELNDEYAFGEDVEYTAPKLDKLVNPKGNQAKLNSTKSACTIVGAVNQIIRLFGLELTEEQTNTLYDEVVKYCTNYGYVIGTGWYIPTACNVVVKWWNEIGYKTFNKEQIFWLRVDWNSPKVSEALSNGHLVGFGKELSWRLDQNKGIIDKESYTKGIGHRLNYQCKNFTKATGGADGSRAEIGCYDNYYGDNGEEYFILDRKKYIFKGIYGYCYIIMPVSCMKSNLEEEKKKIALLKAVNAVIATLTSTRGDLPEAYQELSASYAAALREQYPEARPLMKDQQHKIYQSVVDMLSYCWKYAGVEEQEKFAELAKYLRDKHGLM